MLRTAFTATIALALAFAALFGTRLEQVRSAKAVGKCR